jgi:hypothetical protein
MFLVVYFYFKDDRSISRTKEESTVHRHHITLLSYQSLMHSSGTFVDYSRLTGRNIDCKNDLHIRLILEFKVILWKPLGSATSCPLLEALIDLDDEVLRTKTLQTAVLYRLPYNIS